MDREAGRHWGAGSWRTADTAARWARLGRGGAVVAALVVAVFTLLPAPPAAAHPTLVATTPPAGYAVAEAPREIILDFGEPVGLIPDAVRLGSADGRQVTTSAAELSENGRRMRAALTDELAPGVYRVAWQVRGEDGDLVSGGFSFAVGVGVLDSAGEAAARGAGGSAALNVPVAVLRWVLFAALALGLGGAGGTLPGGRAGKPPVPASSW